MTAVSKRTEKQKNREKARPYRERMRARGLRPAQMWVHDTRAPGFAAEAHRQSVAAARRPTADEDQAFVDAISEFWEAPE